MKKIKLGQGTAVFILFFGVAMLEAFKTGNWSLSIFWMAVGTAFLTADNLKRTKN